MPWGGKSNHNCFLSLTQLVFKMEVSQTRVCVVHVSVDTFRLFLDRNTVPEKMFACIAFDHKIVEAWEVLYEMMLPFFCQEVSLQLTQTHQCIL